jgi:hypothetical protein
MCNRSRGEVFLLEWSNRAKYLFRTLIGLSKFGDIDYGHMRAIFWGKLKDNQYVFVGFVGFTDLMDLLNF